MTKNKQVNTAQYTVISSLNNYLNYHHLPIKVNEEGICHALSTLYIQYVLEGKEQEFENLLSYVAQKINPSPELDIELFNLVEKIIALQVGDAHSTRNKYSQTNSHEQLHVKGKCLRSIYQIGFKTSRENWADIIKQINLKPNEAMRVSSLKHTIAISRDKDGTYKVYDPNNSAVIKTFTDVNKMTRWLSNDAYNFSIFPFGSKTLDLHIDVISTERQSDRVFPNKKALLDKYLTPAQKILKPNTGGGLNFAMKYDDAETSAYILNNSSYQFTEDELTKIALCALMRDSSNSLEQLILKLKKDNKIDILKPIFLFSFSVGSYRCLQKLLEIPELQNLYKELVSNHQEMLLKRAFEGMNEDLIAKVLNDVLEVNEGDIFNPEFLSELIFISVKERNYQGVKLLAETLNDLDKRIVDPKQRLEFIMKAIKENDPLMVRVLIEKLKMTPNELNCLTISLTMIHRQNVEIFSTLQKNGYQFSPQAIDLIESKQKHSVGFLKSLGIALISFSEFLRLQKKITVDPDKIKKFVDLRRINKEQILDGTYKDESLENNQITP
ncbi:hypothetical protein [Legionella waltersii]|uniref:Ankyrin repeat-containing protein n=1 Tax=Legionella waltersii TaxID=66969 RepID=A0A0W1ALI2_9GAMM|nr:hypothetical protein [Legionella waltersii]KTD82177.1 ankyrin repeat-containing protein [Legionella waltersii]SNV10519.1 ankyrin repeat-containing protein [Legionella waltersii]